jgi:hypothetical protein
MKLIKRLHDFILSRDFVQKVIQERVDAVTYELNTKIDKLQALTKEEMLLALKDNPKTLSCMVESAVRVYYIDKELEDKSFLKPNYMEQLIDILHVLRDLGIYSGRH